MIRQLDPNLGEEESAFRSAMVLLAAPTVGPDVDRIAKFTKLDLAFVRERVANCWRNGIFRRVLGQFLIYCQWFDKKGGYVALWCDVLAADGVTVRCKDDGRPEQYQDRDLDPRPKGVRINGRVYCKGGCGWSVPEPADMFWCIRCALFMNFCFEDNADGKKSQGQTAQGSAAGQRAGSTEAVQRR